MGYEEFIQNILDTRGRFACGDEYHERHHILPKCMGGTNDEDNLIDLYAKEHFEAHRLLALENPDNDKLVYALWCMSNVKNEYTGERYQITAGEYEEVRKVYSETASHKYAGDGNPMYGVHRFGENSPHYGKQMSEEARKKISEARVGKYCGENSPNFGNHRFAGENHPLFGKHPSDETRKKISDKMKERYSNPVNHPMSRKVIRLLDLKIYDYIGSAAEDNNVCRKTIRIKCKNHKDFMYYDEWLLEQNNLCLSL